MRMTRPEDGGRRIRSAHRISYELHCGPIPFGLQVLHRCDTPACVNPEHLFLGTRIDNMQDAIAKGRFICGTAHKNAKLTEAQAAAIIADLRIAGSRDNSKLARKYGVSPGTIYLIRDNKIWKHVMR